MLFDTLGKYRNTGLLIIRLGIGTMMMLHGFPKLAGGTEKWTAIGQSMSLLHITFLPVVWGFLAAATEFFGGFLFLLGLAYRPVCLALTFVMAVAATSNLSEGGGVLDASHPIELGILFIGMIFIGPGKYSVDKK